MSLPQVSLKPSSPSLHLISMLGIVFRLPWSLNQANFVSFLCSKALYPSRTLAGTACRMQVFCCFQGVISGKVFSQYFSICRIRDGQMIDFSSWSAKPQHSRGGKKKVHYRFPPNCLSVAASLSSEKGSKPAQMLCSAWKGRLHSCPVFFGCLT